MIRTFTIPFVAVFVVGLLYMAFQRVSSDDVKEVADALIESAPVPTSPAPLSVPTEPTPPATEAPEPNPPGSGAFTFSDFEDAWEDLQDLKRGKNSMMQAKIQEDGERLLQTRPVRDTVHVRDVSERGYLYVKEEIDNDDLMIDLDISEDKLLALTPGQEIAVVCRFHRYWINSFWFDCDSP